MSKLNENILFLIFEELQDDSKSLFSCLMVNRLWCETMVPVLWRNPWSYNDINYSNKRNLFVIITYYLINDIKTFITEQGIQLSSNSKYSLSFDYLSYCRSINIKIINDIISIGSSLTQNQFFIQKKFYFHLMRKCSELRYLDMRSINHRIFSFPEDKACLESLCELKCDTHIGSLYFCELSRFCQHIQRFIIINTFCKSNNGIVKLIEVQKNLKYFEWKDDYKEITEDPYEEILLALEKKANTLNHLKLFFMNTGFMHTSIERILPRFYKLKTLVIDNYIFFIEEKFNKLIYNDLEVFISESLTFEAISSMIVNSRGGNLKKIIINPYDCYTLYDNNFYENSLNLISKIYENCPSIEYLSIIFLQSKEHFNEFENLLKLCQNLKSFLLITIPNDEENHVLEIGEELLKLLIRSSPINLKEIRFFDDFQFSLGNLEEFFKNWKGKSLSILTSDSIYEREDYKKLINEYKNNGVIKDFICEVDKERIHYHF